MMLRPEGELGALPRYGLIGGSGVQVGFLEVDGSKEVQRRPGNFTKERSVVLQREWYMAGDDKTWKYLEYHGDSEI